MRLVQQTGALHFYDDLEKADGVFSDTNLIDWTTTVRKSFVLVRATNDEARVMRQNDEQQATDLVLSKL